MTSQRKASRSIEYTHVVLPESASQSAMRGLVPGNYYSLRLFSGNHAIEEELMSPRNQSGYDPVGDPRTGRPPLPENRDRARRALPEEIDPESLNSSSFAGAYSAEMENEEGQTGDRSEF